MGKRAATYLFVLFVLPGLSRAQALHRNPVPKPFADGALLGYKAIFEPVNYGRDITPTDVFYTSAEVGWVPAEDATILYTTNVDPRWTAQVGDDAANGEHPVHNLRFLSKHGCAIQDNPTRLLCTKVPRTGRMCAGVSLPEYMQSTTCSVLCGVAFCLAAITATSMSPRPWATLATSCSLSAKCKRQGALGSANIHTRVWAPGAENTTRSAYDSLKEEV
jgi:hypothetical protein